MLSHIGENNNLRVALFAADSEYGENVAINLGHHIPSFEGQGLFGRPRAPTQLQFVDESDDEDESGDESVCFAGPSAGWSLDASKCCSGHEFVLAKFENVYQLFGMINAISASLVGSCS